MLPESLDPAFDVGVLGEGEITFQELLNVFLEKESLAPEFLEDVQSIVYHPSPRTPPRQTSLRAPIANLDELPFPDFKFVHPGFFTPEEIPAAASIGIKAYVLSSRGCPYRCIFCSTARSSRGNAGITAASSPSACRRTARHSGLRTVRRSALPTTAVFRVP